MDKRNPNAEWTVEVEGPDGSPVTCRVIPTPERQAGRRRWMGEPCPQWEILAPDGHGFNQDIHAAVCFDVADVLETAEALAVTVCDEECTCGGAGGEEILAALRGAVRTIVQAMKAVDGAAAEN